MKLLGLGDNVMDAYLFRDELYPGGNAANVAVLSKRAGSEMSGYLGVLALDPAGQHFEKVLQEEGIDLTCLRKAYGKTGCNYIHLDENGDRVFKGNNGLDTVQNRFRMMLIPEDYEYILSYDVVHTSIHSLVDDMLPEISQKALVSMDYSSDGFTKVNVKKLAPFLHFAFFSSGGKSAEAMEEIMEFAAGCGIPEVICTLGLNGSCGISNGEKWAVPAYPDDNAIDALGAGDAFISSFLVNYIDNGGKAKEAADTAAHFAAKCCGHHGAFDHPLKISESGLNLK